MHARFKRGQILASTLKIIHTSTLGTKKLKNQNA
jgi:hypothetical protein